MIRLGNPLVVLLITNGIVLVNAYSGHLDVPSLLFLYWVEGLLLGVFFGLRVVRSRPTHHLKAYLYAGVYGAAISLLLYGLVGFVVTGSSPIVAGAVGRFVVEHARLEFWFMLLILVRHAYPFIAEHAVVHDQSTQEQLVPLVAYVLFLFVAGGVFGFLSLAIGGSVGLAVFMVMVRAALDLWTYMGDRKSI